MIVPGPVKVIITELLAALGSVLYTSHCDRLLKGRGLQRARQEYDWTADCHSKSRAVLGAAGSLKAAAVTLCETQDRFTGAAADMDFQRNFRSAG